ncbi:MAG: hypothetical protein ACUVWJ_06625 [Spirochaetota bacterium]
MKRKKDGKKEEDKETFTESVDLICKNCGRSISEYDFFKYGGMCKYCAGAIPQQGFPSPPGFPKLQ